MRKASFLVLLLTVIAVVLVADLASAVSPGGTAVARLRSFEEVPAVSTSGGGRFSATINEAGTEMLYDLEYFALQGTITQAHIHFAQRGVNGGIMVFLCSNLGNGPAGTQLCPTSPGIISGSIRSNNIGNGAASQGLTEAETSAFLRAVRAGVAYVNIHTNTFPGGEIRGQLLYTESD